MSIQTYSRYTTTDGTYAWPLRHLDQEGRPVSGAPDLPFRPGDTVHHVRRGGSGYGTVIATSDVEVTVLWSEEPASDTFDYVAFPTVRRVQPGLIASQVTSIQPMTAPSSKLFFMDYPYHTGSRHPKKGPA